MELGETNAHLIWLVSASYLKEQEFHCCGTLSSGSICILFITLNMAIMS